MNLRQIAEGYINLSKKGLGISDEKVEQLATARYIICDTCPNRSDSKCNVCGCLLGAKIRSVEATCPKDKW